MARRRDQALIFLAGRLQVQQHSFASQHLSQPGVLNDLADLGRVSPLSLSARVTAWTPTWAASCRRLSPAAIRAALRSAAKLV